MNDTPTIGFIGLGNIGYPMASHIASAGHHVKVYNRTPEKITNWKQDNPTGIACISAADVASGIDILILCLNNEHDIADVLFDEDNLVELLTANSIVIDHTTTSASFAEQTAKHLHTHNIHFLDAPVSGGVVGAQDGTLSIMAGGEQEILDRSTEILQLYGKNIHLMGPTGSGQLTKMVNQICIANIVQGLAEAIHFGTQAGLDMHRVLDVISTGAAQSRQMENRGPTMLSNTYDFGFAVDLIRKDLDIVMHQAATNNASLPSTATITQSYKTLQRNGKGDLDFTALLTLLQH